MSAPVTDAPRLDQLAARLRDTASPEEIAALEASVTLFGDSDDPLFPALLSQSSSRVAARDHTA